MTIAVLGLGGMGSAALFHLAKRGARAIGIEQFAPAHVNGSSHGSTRIIRQAYFEDPSYVPMLLRAYELWEELDLQAPERLWSICGGLTIGLPRAQLPAGTLASAVQYALPHEVFETREARLRYPAFKVRDGEIAIFEPAAGALFPERCVAEHLRRATAVGAQTRFETPVMRIDPTERGVTLALAGGERLYADRVVLCAGAWTSELAPLPVRIERNVQHWFDPGAGAQPEHVFMVQREDWPRLLYGFPQFGEGIKAAFHHSGEYIGDAARHERGTRPDEIQTVRAALGEVLANAPGAYRRSDPCMYSMTPDEHFVIGTVPELPNVILAGGFSGHGFKFCPVIGQILADLALDGATHHDIELFEPRRFAEKPSS